MASARIGLAAALTLTRTGDVWLFRGRTMADRTIQVTTNSPINHVGMAVVLDDLPPLMWHAELGRSLPDMWSGTHQHGVQLHDLHDAVGMVRGQDPVAALAVDRPHRIVLSNTSPDTLAPSTAAALPALLRNARPGQDLPPTSSRELGKEAEDHAPFLSR